MFYDVMPLCISLPVDFAINIIRNRLRQDVDYHIITSSCYWSSALSIPNSCSMVDSMSSFNGQLRVTHKPSSGQPIYGGP